MNTSQEPMYTGFRISTAIPLVAAFLVPILNSHKLPPTQVSSESQVVNTLKTIQLHEIPPQESKHTWL